MEPRPNTTPLIVIVGETGSGKSALAVELARQYGGEIIAADSRTIYRGMDIGTAKPSPQDRRLVPHHLLDIASPDEEFTVVNFKRQANDAIGVVTHRGHLPFLVGGTGLYVDAVIYDFQFRPKPDKMQRQSLQVLGIADLQQKLIEQGIPMPSNERNPRHLLRALETRGAPALRSSLRGATLLIGISINREELHKRIVKRIDTMLEAGLVSEVRSLVERFGWDAPGLQAPGYRTLRPLLEGVCTLDETRQQLLHEHLHLAKRQRTWFKRNRDIKWICKKEEAVDLITTFLNK